MKDETNKLEKRRDFLRRSIATVGGLAFLMVAGKNSVANETKVYGPRDCRGTCTAICQQNCGLGCKADGHKPAVIAPNGCEGGCEGSCSEGCRFGCHVGTERVPIHNS